MCENYDVITMDIAKLEKFFTFLRTTAKTMVGFDIRCRSEWDTQW